MRTTLLTGIGGLVTKDPTRSWPWFRRTIERLGGAAGCADTGPAATPEPGTTSAISDGRWWFPGPDALPHTVTGDHRDNRIVLTDQYRGSYHNRPVPLFPPQCPIPGSLNCP